MRLYTHSDWRRGQQGGIRWLSAHLTIGRWFYYAHIAVCGFALQVESDDEHYAAALDRYDREWQADRLLESIR